jgi:hypothetical protein
MTADEFTDVRRLTALADDLQRQVDGLQREIMRLRALERDLQRRLADAPRSRRPSLPAAMLPATSEAAPAISRQQRRAAERVQKRARGPQTPAALMLLQPPGLGGMTVPER